MTKEERIQLRDELLKELLKNKIIICNKNGIYSIHRMKKFLIYLENNAIFKEKYNLYINQFRTEEEAKYCLTHQDDFENHKCRICGNILSFYFNPISKMNKHYERTCGDINCFKAIMKSDETKEKAINTSLKIYGTKYAAQSKKIKEKILQSIWNKYKVKNVAQLKSTILKIKNTKLIRYGDPNYNNRLKAEETCKRKYNVKNVMIAHLLGEIDDLDNKNRNKRNNTMLNRYNTIYALQNINCMNKRNSTMLNRYGEIHALRIKIFKNKQRNTYYKNHGPVNIITDDNIQKIILSLKNIFLLKNIELYDIYTNKKYFAFFIKFLYNKMKRKIRLLEIANIFNRSPQSIKERVLRYDLLNYFDIKNSELELQFKELLENAEFIQNVDFERANRNILPKNKNTEGQPELDFYLKDYNIAFEINDIASHSSIKKNKDYHLNKTLQCKEKRIRLIHLWEWELTDEDLWARTSNWILNLLNDSKIQIDIKDCTIKEVNIEEEKEFLNEYHIEGYIKSEICLGLYCDNQLIQLMSFCTPRYNKNYEYELLRLCTKFGYKVLFGAEKLLKNFIKNYNPKSLISYCNLDKFSGKIYKKIGFKLLKRNSPFRIWFDQETQRIVTEQSLLALSAKDNKLIENSPYQSVYNCGQNVYILNF